MACFSKEKNKMRNYEESGNFFPFPVLELASALVFVRHKTDFSWTTRRKAVSKMTDTGTAYSPLSLIYAHACAMLPFENQGRFPARRLSSLNPGKSQILSKTCFSKNIQPKLIKYIRQTGRKWQRRTQIKNRLDQWQSGKLDTGSRVQSSPRAFR